MQRTEANIIKTENSQSDADSDKTIHHPADISMHMNSSHSNDNSMGRLKPKPQRPSKFWLSFIGLKRAGLNNAGKLIMEEKAQVTCRQCCGFGHSLKNCATTRRIENFKQYNVLSKTFFAQFQRK